MNWLVFGGAVGGIAGVVLLVITSDAQQDWIGAIGGAASMALGVVLTILWQLPVPLLTFASWQLVADRVLLVPFAIAFEPSLPPLSALSNSGYVYLWP